MGKGIRKTIQNDPSNKTEANPNPQMKTKYTKRNWNDYLEKNDNHTQEKNNDEIPQEDN